MCSLCNPGSLMQMHNSDYSNSHVYGIAWYRNKIWKYARSVETRCPKNSPDYCEFEEIRITRMSRRVSSSISRNYLAAPLVKNTSYLFALLLLLRRVNHR
jgi:hypothetical protein